MKRNVRKNCALHLDLSVSKNELAGKKARKGHGSFYLKMARDLQDGPKEGKKLTTIQAV